jgi:hypothetical protein
MRKLFRMKYESCAGGCYAWSDVMRIHTLGLDVQGAAAFLRRLLAIHDPACGNAALGYRLDHDEELGVFVASFERYGSLDLFAGRTPLEALDKLIDAALRYYQSDEYVDAVSAAPGAGHDVCEHGTDPKLVSFALTFSGLNDAEQDAVRAEIGL